jgi:hypothetical protein
VGCVVQVAGGATVDGAPCAYTADFFEVITAAAPAMTLPLIIVRLSIVRGCASSASSVFSAASLSSPSFA